MNNSRSHADQLIGHIKKKSWVQEWIPEVPQMYQGGWRNIVISRNKTFQFKMNITLICVLIINLETVRNHHT